MYFPSGENLMAFTGFWKLKWCRTMPRRTLTRSALPSCFRLENPRYIYHTVLTFVHANQDIGVRTQSNGSYILAILKRERVGLVTRQYKPLASKMNYEHVLHKVKHSDPISDWTINRVSIRCEHNVPLPIDSPAQIGKLGESLVLNSTGRFEDTPYNSLSSEAEI